MLSQGIGIVVVKVFFWGDFSTATNASVAYINDALVSTCLILYPKCGLQIRENYFSKNHGITLERGNSET